MDNNNKVDDWAVTTNRYVAYIDIMGFKEMVLRSTHDEVYQMMKKIEDVKKLNQNIEWTNAKRNLVKSTNYSDSIIIYSKDDSPQSLDSLIFTVSGITNDLFEEGIPHKGAIAFGTMTLDYDKSIFFGQPLIDAYLLEEELYFYGVIIHATAEKNINDKKQDIPCILEYLCPLKNGSSKHLTIFPLFSDTDLSIESNKLSNKILEAIKHMRYKTSGHLRKYIDNTEAYLKKVIKEISE